MLLTNKQVLSSHSNAFSVYKIGDDGVTTLRLIPDSPAVVLRAEDAAPYKGILKKDFQKAHRGEAGEEEYKDILRAYGSDKKEFHSMRTVGCGASVFLSLADGLFLLGVQRSAPSKTPEGVVMPGAFSRAAGGATGDIPEAGFRELTEELHIGVKQGNKLISFDIVPANPDLSRSHIAKELEKKHTRAQSIFSQHTGVTSEVEHHHLQAEKLSIDGLTQNVRQIIGRDEKLLKNYIVVDNPENGDVSGVDSILFASIPDVISNDLILADGETDLDGNLLNRLWQAKKLEEWHDALLEGEAKFSPAFEKVVENYTTIKAAIGCNHRLKP